MSGIGCWDVTPARPTCSFVAEEDGLIFAKVHEPYKHGQCNTLLKFKDSKDNSIDFLVKVRAN